MPGLPQHVLPAHALEAAQDVLQRVVERVAHVQRAGHVRRRDDDAIGLRIRAVGPAGLEGLARFPKVADPFFHRGRFEGLFHGKAVPARCDAARLCMAISFNG